MRIRVKVYATLRQYFPETELGEEKQVQIPNDGTIADILELLEIPKEKMKIALVNGIRKENDYELEDGDLVVFFPPVGGG